MAARYRITLSAARDQWISEHSWHSKGTRATYASAITIMVKDVGDIEVAKVTADHVAALVAGRSTRDHWSLRTVKQTTSRLRMFFDWCQAQGYHPGPNPATPHNNRVRGLRNPEATHLRIGRDEWPLLLDAADQPTHRALIATGLYTCLRIGDLCSLRLQDLNTSTWTLSASIEKTKITRSIPVPNELQAELVPYLRWYGRFSPRQSHPLFPPIAPRTRQGNEFSWHDVVPETRKQNPQAAGQRIKGILERAGYSGYRIGAHTLRRSGARAYYDHLVDSGYDGALRAVQTLLGHSSPTITEKYLGVDLDQHRLADAMSGWMFGEPDAPGVRGVG